MGICVEWWQLATEFGKEGGQGHVFITNPTNSSVSTLQLEKNDKSELGVHIIIYFPDERFGCFGEPKNVLSLHMRGWCGFGQQPQPHPIPAHSLELSKWVCGPIVGTSNSKDNCGRWIRLGILSSG